MVVECDCGGEHCINSLGARAPDYHEHSKLALDEDQQGTRGDESGVGVYSDNCRGRNLEKAKQAPTNGVTNLVPCCLTPENSHPALWFGFIATPSAIDASETYSKSSWDRVKLMNWWRLRPPLVPCSTHNYGWNRVLGAS